MVTVKLSCKSAQQDTNEIHRLAHTPSRTQHCTLPKQHNTQACGPTHPPLSPKPQKPQSISKSRSKSLVQLPQAKECGGVSPKRAEKADATDVSKQRMGCSFFSGSNFELC